MRSKWKGKFINRDFYNNFFFKKKKNFFATRNSIINYKFEQSYFLIHNGNSYLKMKVVKKAINFNFGDFSITRRKVNHI